MNGKEETQGDVIERSSLGRDAFLGDFYNARTDTFCCTSIFKKTPPDDLLLIQDTNRCDIQYTKSDCMSEKFEKLGVQGELKLSFLCNLIEVGGSAQYLSDSKKSEKIVRCSLVYNILTKSKKFNFLNPDLFKNHIDLNALSDENATHVVQKINWGAGATITLESRCENADDKTEIEGSLEGALKLLGMGIKVKGSFESDKRETLQNLNYSLKVHADVLPKGSMPQTAEEAIQFITSIPTLLNECNNGLGKPVSISLIPIQTVRKLLKMSDIKYDVIVKTLSDDQIVRYVLYFDDMSYLKQRLNDRVEMIKKHRACLLDSHNTEALHIQQELLTFEAGLKKKLADALVSYRKGDIQYINIPEFEKTTEFTLRYDELKKTVEKIQRYQIFVQNGVSYVGNDTNLDLALVSIKEAFVLFISEKLQESDPELFRKTFNFFIDLKGKSEAKFLVCDLDLCQQRDIQKVCIWHIINNKTITEDYYGDSSSTNGLNLMYCSEKHDYTRVKPNMRIELELVCPGFFHNTCEHEPVLWHCKRCKAKVEYGFDFKFYCTCGSKEFSKFMFRCSNDHHFNFIPFDDEFVLKDFLSVLRPLKELNILVLGQTGVGKSTWLNSIVNYMTYETLEEAKKEGACCVIPSSFTVTDNDYQEVEVKIGSEDSNEVLKSGLSATQGPKSYTFKLKDTMVRLIDTPGIGDVRGLEKDKENVKQILDHISHLSELHGICILMKPNEARISVLFRFCIKELLVHLHKSASRNIVFCFTNARSTFYRPGDTLPVLRGLLEELDSGLVVSKHTIYCLDNESFRFLCTLKYPTISYSDDEKESYRGSWDKSVSETSRLLQHFQSLDPHPIKDTTTLCEARRIILNLTKPMADISQNIELNIAAMKEHTERIENSKNSEKELAKNLYIPQIILVPRKLDFPRTVCTSPKCVDYFKLKATDTSQTLYKTHCHTECYLRNVTPDVYPNAELRNCQAMGGSTRCRHCGCDWSVHMHITYEQDRKEQQVINENIQSEIKQNVSLREKVQNLLKETQEVISQNEKEREVITKTSARFGQFLKANAIAPYNDAMKAYIEMQISIEQNKVQKTNVDKNTLSGLREMLSRYDEEVAILNSSMDTGDTSSVIQASEVKKLVQELYSLKINGPQLKSNVEMAETSNTSAMRYSEYNVYLPPSRKKDNFFKRMYNRFM